MLMRKLSIMMLMLLGMLMFSAVFAAIPVMAEDTGAKIWTDKADYSSGETVVVYGSGYNLEASVNITVTRPDATVDEWAVTSDSSGSFTTTYVLNGITGTYTVTATDGTNTATTTFTDTKRPLQFKETGLPSGTTWSVTVPSAPKPTTKTSTTDTIAFSVDPGDYSFTVLSPISGGTGVRYVASPSSGTATVPEDTGPVIVSITFTTQYQVSFAVNPSGSGTTTPSGTAFYDAGSISISATPSTGYVFSSWTTSTPSITIASTSSASTTATISGTGTITANFQLADNTPPTTVKTLSGTSGSGGWYTSNVGVTLAATDNAGGSGVKEIHYKLNGVETVVSGSSATFTISTEGTNTLVHWAVDNAGNAEAQSSQDIKIDKTAPTTEKTLSGTKGTDPWWVSNVGVSLTASDTGTSGVKEIHYILDSGTPVVVSGSTASFTISDEGTHSVEHWAVDNAGNVETHATQAIKIDKTPPTTTKEESGTKINEPWYVSSVEVTLSATDPAPGSGVAKTEYSFDGVSWTTYSGSFVISDEGKTTLYYRSTDVAGNVETAKSQDIYIDTKAPTTSKSESGTSGLAGWYVSPVTVTLSAEDPTPGSGVAKLEYRIDDGEWNTIAAAPFTATFTIAEDGTYTVEYKSTDVAGNVEDLHTQTIKIDKTPPEVTLTADRTPDSNGWYNHKVSFTVTATDATSGVDPTKTVTPLDYSGPDFSSVTVTGSATDYAGNTASASLNFKYDATPPVVTLATPTDGAEYLLNQVVVAVWSATDATSGIASESGTVPSGQPIDTSSVGPKTFTVTATDNAGNTATQTITYYVRYVYSGVLQPINPDGSSIFKLGSTVPVKFQLRDANGNFVTNAIAKIFVTKISNGITGTELEAVSTSAATTGNLFRYDPTNNQYIFNLNTKPLSTGTWQIRIELDDGTSKYVNISLR